MRGIRGRLPMEILGTQMPIRLARLCSSSAWSECNWQVRRPVFVESAFYSRAECRSYDAMIHTRRYDGFSSVNETRSDCRRRFRRRRLCPKERRITVRLAKNELQMILDALQILSPDSTSADAKRYRLIDKLSADKNRCFPDKP